MEELLEALEALERLGAEWKARRVSKKFLFDTVECIALVQTAEGESVIRGLVGVQRWDGYCRTKIEVVCYLDGQLDDKGAFKHARHPKDKTVKIFEYEDEVLYKYSKVLGVGLGWRPAGVVPEEHDFLVGFSEWLIIKADADKKATDEETAAVADEHREENEGKARRALFG